jgi:hypothetical protein
MAIKEQKQKPDLKVFNPRKSIKRAGQRRAAGSKWIIATSTGDIN